MTDNFVEAVTSRYVDVYFRGRRTCRTSSITQRDHGRIYRFKDLALPSTFEIHFANSQTGQSKRVIGENNEVEIPDEYLVDGQNVYAFIFLHETANDGETRYTIISPVTAKGPVEDSEPTPVQQDIITQAIAALNAGVETVQEIAEGIPEQIDTALAEAKASGEFDGPQGVPGQPGQPGADGYSPTVTVQDITGGHRVTITDAEGDHVFDVMDGQGGGGTSDYTDLTNKPQINGVTLEGNKSLSALGIAAESAIPTKVSDLTNDSGYITGYTETDPTVPAWAKAQTKPTYTAQEVGALPDSTVIPTKVSDLEDDSGHYTKPASGIPASDLAQAVQTSLGEVGSKVGEVLVDGESVVDGGTASIPRASSSDFGVIKTSSSYGTGVTSAGNLYIYRAQDSNIKAGSNDYRPITPTNQHLAVFYGLAKAAGYDLKNETVTVGQYPAEAIAAIKSMLGITS